MSSRTLKLLFVLVGAGSAACVFSQNDADPSSVFKKAFQTPLVPPGIVVHDALHWQLRHGPFVEEWQWFLSFTPTDDFAAWLLSDKAYRLQRLDSPGAVDRSRWLHESPDWFAPGSAGPYDVWQTEDRHMTLFVSTKSHVHYMTDHAVQ